MSQLIYIFLATVLTATNSLFLGNAVLRATNATLHRTEAKFLAFVVGSGLLAPIVLALSALGFARRGYFLALSGVVLALAIWRGAHRFPTASAEPASLAWRRAFWAIYVLFAFVYCVAALTPPTVIDGTFLPDTIALARQHGLVTVLDPTRALFLFAFAIGRHSAVPMTAVLFLLALPFGIRALGERLGYPQAGMVAALLFFLSPVVGRAGTIAAPDLILTATAFAFFYSIHVKLYVPAAILAGAWLAGAHPFPSARDWHPLEVTTLGDTVTGLIGPVFLLAPIAVLSWTIPTARRLLAAALIFAVPFAISPTPRALIPALPFLALALAFVLAGWRYTLPAVLAAHTIFSWPSIVSRYTNDNTWRVHHLEWSAALRIEPEDHYLMREFHDYYSGRLLEKMVPDGQQVLALAPFQQVYHTRPLVQDSQLRDLLLSGVPTPDALKQSGTRWVLANSSDPRARVLLSQAAEWGLDVRFQQEAWILFEVR